MIATHDPLTPAEATKLRKAKSEDQWLVTTRLAIAKAAKGGGYLSPPVFEDRTEDGLRRLSYYDGNNHWQTIVEQPEDTEAA